MGLKRVLLLSCAATGTFFGLSGAALAQDSAAFGDIVVTAEKREQSVQDVPVAVTAITADTREDLGIISMEDYARIAPGVVYTNNDRLTIRGAGRMTNAIGTDPAAAAYNDGIFSNSMQFTTASPMYLARTEILRGPQGTLYGRNAVAGLINVISREPSDEYEAEIRSRIGNYGRHDFEGLITGPITDNLRFYAGYSTYNQTDGFIENTGPGEDTGTQFRTYYEGKLQWEPTANLEMNLRVQAALWDDTYGVGNVLQNVIAPYNTTSLEGAPGGGQNLYYNTQFTGVAGGVVDGRTNPALADPYRIHSDADAIGELHDNITTSFILTWDLDDNWSVRYLAGFATYKYYTTGVDADQTAQTTPWAVHPGTGALGVSRQLIGNYHEAQEWWSNEINLSWTGDTFHWIGGLYQYHQDYSQDIGLRVVGDIYVNNPAGYLLGVPGGAEANPNGFLANSEGTLLVDSYAVFNQADWEFSPGLTASLGLRYTWDEKEGVDYTRIIGRNLTTFALHGPNQARDFTIAAVCVPNVTFTMLDCPSDFRVRPGQGGLERDLSYSSEALTGTAKLVWEPSDDLNFYVSYSRGYKSGGWFGISTMVLDAYADPEYIDAYEFGAKMTFFDSFIANASIYYNDYQGMQMPLPFFNGTVTQTELQNLDSEIRGVELEMQWYPFGDFLQLFANVAYTDSEITRGCCFIDAADPGATAPGARPQDNPATVVDSVGNPQVEQTLVGNRNVNSPEWRYALGFLTNWNTSVGSIQFTGTFAHTDDMQYRPFANPIYTSPANDIANFRLIWNSPDDDVRIAAYVNNAFNEEAYLFQDNYSNPSPARGWAAARSIVAMNIPQEYGVELQFHF